MKNISKISQSKGLKWIMGTVTRNNKSKKINKSQNYHFFQCKVILEIVLLSKSFKPNYKWIRLTDDTRV